MNAVTFIGKYLFGIAFIIFGILYLVNAEAMTVLLPLTGGVVWVYVSGLVMLFAGVAVLIGRKDAVATFLLGTLFLIYVFFIHLPDIVSSNFTDTMAAHQFLKDLAIAGAALVYSRSAAKDRTWRLI